MPPLPPHLTTAPPPQLMPTYVCREWEGEPHGAEGQALAWVTPAELEAGGYEMPPADIPLLPPVLAAMRGQAP